MKQKTLKFNSTNNLEIIKNQSKDKTLIVHSVTMKLENSTNAYAGVVLKYSDGTQIALSSSVNNNQISNIFDAGSNINVKEGQNIMAKANDGLTGELTIIINYDLI